jgi:calcineurin-like phosphoesterase family protein
MIPYLKKRCKFVGDMLDIKVEGQYITLSHYAMRVWNKSHFNSWNLFGHSHGTLKPVGKSMDVGVDVNDFKLVSYDQVKEFMSKQNDNENFIPLENRR